MAEQEITALLLAGGQSRRMGGADKGLLAWRDNPLAVHALERLQQQRGSLIARVLINANRNLSAYASLGRPYEASVITDANTQEFAGPLAGFLAGLKHCSTPYLLTVPCDSPLFPLDLAQRLHDALQADNAQIAIAYAPEPDHAGKLCLRSQPVFCLMRRELQSSLECFMQAGGRKIDAWTALHRTTPVPFNQPHDDPHAFANINTRDDLHSMQ